MLNTVKTIYSGMIQTHKDLGLPYVPQENSTLNEIWNIHDNTPIPANSLHRLSYIAIGNGGHRYITGPEQIPYTEEVEHIATHGGPYKPLPFIMRPVNQDLTPSQRAPYAMRALITVGSTQYWAYYLRKVDTTGITPEYKITTIVDGVPSDIPFIPDNSTLTPTPPEIPSSGATTTNGQFVTIAAPLKVVFTNEDIAELMNCCDILFNNPKLAIISELMVVSSIPAEVPLLDTSLNPTLGNYWEALRAQVTNFVEASYNAHANQGGFEIDLNVGVNDPLFGPGNIQTTPLT
jgi:hypothetical protein